MKQQKILLAQLNSNGDCLYATVIARQIKEVDYPGCHLTWAVNSRSKQSILANPHIDDTWEIETAKSLASDQEWCDFVKQAEIEKKNGRFDQVFFTQIIGKNMINLDGDIRASLYRNYPHPITVSQQPVLQLLPSETESVKQFAARFALHNFKNVVLVECGPISFRSSLNIEAAMELAAYFTEADPGIAFILSSSKKIESNSSQIIDGSLLSYRENAELTKYCHVLLGCSSGISWLSTSNWAKPLPKILIINDKAVLNSSMVHDHELAGLPASSIIELHEGEGLKDKIINCLRMVLDGQVSHARTMYHQPYQRKNFKFLYHVAKSSFAQGKIFYPVRAFRRSIQKDGLHANAIYQLIKSYIKLPVYLVKNLVSPRCC